MTQHVIGLMTLLEAYQQRALKLAAGSRFGSDILLLFADALTLRADDAEASWDSLVASAFRDCANTLRDEARAFTGAAARTGTEA